MKVWIMIIIMLRPKLKALCEMLEDRIYKLATNICADTLETIYQIEDLNTRKIKFINFKILNDRLVTALGEDYKILYQYSFGKSILALADDFKMGKNKMSRLLDKLFADAEEILYKYGFNAVKLDNEYKSVDIIKRLYIKLNKSVKRSSRPHGEACALSAVV